MVFGPYQGKVLSVHDGDTLTVGLQLSKKVSRSHAVIDIDLGFNVHQRNDGVWLVGQRVRLYGCNAPELATPEGKAAVAYLLTLVKPGDPVTVLSHGWDKYAGRVDGTVTLADGTNLTDRMISAGHAAAWDGRGPKPVPAG